MNQEERKSYANVLVLAAARRNAPGVGVLATGMTMTGKRLKTRVATVMQKRQPIRWLATTFAVLASICLVCAFATSETAEQLEMGFGWSVSEHTLAEVLPSSRHISNEQDAISYTRKLCERYWPQDSEITFTAGRNDDTSWLATVTGEGTDAYFEVFFMPNGTVGSLLQNTSDKRWLTDGQYIESQLLGAGELAEVRDWALQQMETINPGISHEIQELQVNYVRDMGDAKVIFLHADPVDSRYDYGVNFIVRLDADHSMVLLEFSMVGNG